MCGYRWRNLYYLSGQPGWVRFGYSPGWVGRSPTGLPPCVQYPRFTTWLQEQQPPAAPAGIPTLTREQEIAALESQAQLLGDQLERVKKQLAELRK